MKKDKSIFSEFLKLQNIGMEIALPIVLVLAFFWMRDDYKEKHDECRIYQHNLNATFTLDEVLSINKQENTICIRYLTIDSNIYKMLDDEFIKNVQIGDSIHKFRSENIVTIFHGDQRKKVPFSQVPEKECK